MPSWCTHTSRRAQSRVPPRAPRILSVALMPMSASRSCTASLTCTAQPALRTAWLILAAWSQHDPRSGHRLGRATRPSTTRAARRDHAIITPTSPLLILFLTCSINNNNNPTTTTTTTHTCTCACHVTYICIHIHMHMHTYMHICMHANIYIPVQHMHMHMHMHMLQIITGRGGHWQATHVC